MTTSYTSYRRLREFELWEKLGEKRTPLLMEYELTARCNNDCRHCYINLATGDREARARELNLVEIERLAEEATELGTLWCLLTGGEPLLREDFVDVYQMLRRKGLLVSVFTNACLVTDEHARLFAALPPRDVEVTVYGVTRETYETVSRRRGSYEAFRRGLDRLWEAGVPVRLKAMALRSNVHELPLMAEFCRARTKDYFRYDTLLHLRFDGDEERNREIRGERLTAAEIAALERADVEKFAVMQANCDRLLGDRAPAGAGAPLFLCGAGRGSFAVGYDGTFRLCSSLWHPECIADLRRVALREAWEGLVPTVLARRSTKPEFLRTCASCGEVNLCLWCPAHAYLETGQLDVHVDAFCAVARARAAQLVAGRSDQAASPRRPENKP